MCSSRLSTGKRAEAIAADHLVSKGFRILCKNWRNPHGEIDLVATEGETMVFVEVRSRTGTQHGHPLESISSQKRSRIIRAARHFLDAEHPIALGFRFDVISVTFPEEGIHLPPEVMHITNAIQTDL